jgi:adenosylhomocysteine nucleosidase
VTVGASGVAAGGRPLLIVTGLFSEARIAAGPGMTVICSSSDPGQLRAQLEAFDHASVRGIISFGIAGGLDPSLRAGDLVVANEIMMGGQRFATTPALSENLVERTNIGRRRIVGGAIVGAEEVMLDPRDKELLHEETGATAVDMESHIAAAYAASVGLPFAAVRVINDPASRSLPALALNALKPNGNICPRKVLRGLAREPSVIPSLMRTAHDFNRAIATLRRCRGLLLNGGGGLVPANL